MIPYPSGATDDSTSCVRVVIGSNDTTDCMGSYGTYQSVVCAISGYYDYYAAEIFIWIDQEDIVREHRKNLIAWLNHSGPAERFKAKPPFRQRPMLRIQNRANRIRAPGLNNSCSLIHSC
jgi:hypothetical protein